MVKVAEEVLPKSKKKAEETWMTENILEKMSERNKVKSTDSVTY